MDAHALHPERRTLQIYAHGKLDDASSSVINKHLEDCPACQRQVAEMAPDSFPGHLRDAQERRETSPSSSATADERPTGSMAAHEATADSLERRVQSRR